MSKKLLSIILAVCMLLALFAGCGNSSAATEEAASSAPAAEDSAEPEAAEEAPAEEPAAEEPAPETEEVSAEEASAVEEVEEPEPELEPISYPIGEGLTINCWTAFDSNAFGSYGFESYNDLAALDVVEEATGVRYTYTEVSFFSASEQFNLMIASGDWPDVMNCNRYYTGGLSQALSDDVIVDLTDLLTENMPDYYKVLMSEDKTTQDNVLTDGRVLQLCSMYDEYINDGGAYTRGDWLKELGTQWPDTFEGFIDLLYQVHDTYGSAYTYPTDPGGGISGAEAYFGTELFSMRTDNSDLAIYVGDDGVIQSGVTSDGYRAYLELFLELYQAGVINQDFYVSELGRADTMGYIGSGDIFIWTGRADTMNDPVKYADEANSGMVVQPITTYFPGESGEYDFMDEVVYASTDGISITTACEDPAMVMKFMNYFYTDEGALLVNYGVEGVSWEYNDAGEPEFTDLIMNNPQGMNFNTAVAINGMSGVVAHTDNSVKLAAYSDEVVAAVNMFSDLTGTSTLHTYPNGAALDAAEADSIANQLTDIVAYATEQALRFAIGSDPLTDESWDAYVQNCNDLGLLDCIEVYQTAYDDYLAA